MSTQYPSQVALEAEESTLSQEVADYRAARTEYYDRFNLAHVKEIYIERASTNRLTPVKASASKAHHVKALVQNDVQQSQTWLRLIALRKAAEADESIAEKAQKAETPEQVSQARKAAFLERLDGERFTDSDDLADLAFEYEIRLQVAACWANVRYAIEQGNTPVEALRAVVQDAKDRVTGLALHGIYKSSSVTSNLKTEYTLKGLAKFVDSVKYDLKNLGE